MRHEGENLPALISYNTPLAFHSLLVLPHPKPHSAFIENNACCGIPGESGERRNVLSKHLKRVRGWNVNFDA